ncbi:hypothetical protein L210DRAFT_937788 [Boletus edulis BED1]|uniref:Uncharacterized protein n=1 Tax=Boletus edulis BED1 TaxID=1328754 RepID=A0AAD4GGC9_BOLED|nr:hypothetical protein L210DRAFT_937788 [Boletus edulis BED1]
MDGHTLKRSLSTTNPLMLFCLICFLRMLNRSQQTNPVQQYPFHTDLTAELEDSGKFSLASLMALLTILSISGSKALQPVVLTLLMYTITLRFALSTCFLQNYPTVSRLLHVIPLLGTACTIGVELVSGMQSPALAVVCILLGILPLVTMVVHHGRQCTEPMRMEHVPAPAVSGSPDTTPASNQAEGNSETFSTNPC